MEIIKLYYLNDECAISHTEEYLLSSWYCKPVILSSLAGYKKCDFLICSKYGYKQFSPKFSKAYPVAFVFTSKCSNNLDRIFIEFEDLVGYDSGSSK